MELLPVKSSHVAAVGYIEHDQVLLVRFKDGSLHARIGCTADQFKRFMESESKGAFLRVYDWPSVLISKGGARKTETPEQAGRPTAGGPLNVLDEDAGKCCARAMRNLGEPPRIQQWACPECGLEFISQEVGPTRYWRIKPMVVIHRK